MTGVKLIIAGTKSIEYDLITVKAINEWCACNPDKSISVIITKGMKGPETHAIEYAHNNKMLHIEFIPDRNMHGKNAVMNCNINMAKDGDELLAIYNGENKSINHLIDTMVRLDKPVWVYDISKQPIQLRRVM
jgi:hypothetical protein